MKLRKAEIKDVFRIVDFLSESHLKESLYSKIAEYCRDTSIQTFANYIQDSDSVTFIVEGEDNEIYGVGCMFLIRTYYKQKEANITYFYINPKYRGCGVSRVLAQALTDFAKSNGAVIIYASSGSGFDDKGKNNSLWINLWSKFGFKPLGTEMIYHG